MPQAPETAHLSPFAVVAGACGEADEGRLRRLVERHFELCGRMIRNVGAPENDVDDLVQQAFSITATRLPDIEPGKERAFLIQTGIRLAANARRTRAEKREVALDEAGDIADRGPSPEEASEQRRQLRVLDRLLEAMDVDLRSVFVMYEVEEMTMAEISVLLEVPAGTVASRLRRAREDFLSRREALGRSVQSKRGVP